MWEPHPFTRHVIAMALIHCCVIVLAMAMMATPMLTRVTRLALADGSQIPCAWKAVKYDNGDVFWEVRRILETVGWGEANGMNNFMRNTVPKVSKFLESWVSDIDAFDIKENYRVLFGKGEGLEENTRDEKQMSTQSALLFFMAGADTAVCRGANRAACIAALHAMCAHQLPAHILENDDVSLTFAGPAGVQCRYKIQGGRCQHELLVQPLLGEAKTPGDSPQMRLGKLLEKLPVHVRGCPVGAQWLSSLVSDVANMIDKTLAGMKEYDPFLETLPLAFSNSAKKRRRDQDTREAVTRRALVEKRASSSGGWAATLAVPKTTVWDWRNDFIAEYFASAWTSIGAASTIAVVGDGGRAGEPPKEYFFGAVYNCDDHVACWGRPHVRYLFSLLSV